jgi:hypothetical protein
MDRVGAYGLLAAELDRWRTLPRSEVVGRLGKPASITSAVLGDVLISIEVIVTWANGRQTKLRVAATAYGPSHWQTERLEEAITLEPLEPPRPVGYDIEVLVAGITDENRHDPAEQA